MQTGARTTKAPHVLKELHELHTELEDCKTQLQRLPLQLKAKEADVAKREASLKTARESVKRSKADADQKELQLRSGDARLRDLKIKLNQCRSTQEYGAIQAEMKSVQDGNNLLEEQILELITQQETRAAEMVEVESALAAAGDDLTKFRELVAYRTQKLTDRVVLLEQKIAEIAATLDPDTRTLYSRMVQQKGASAIAACEAGNCQACYIEQSPQGIAELNAGKVIRCHSCGALLYAI